MQVFFLNKNSPKCIYKIIISPGASIHQTINDIEPPYKRRRTNTVDIPPLTGSTTTLSSDLNKRTKRIHGRMPIERMRKLK